MKKIFLSDAGPKVSPAIYGFYRWDAQDLNVTKMESIVDLCLELGINTFDHADIYGDYMSEQLFGEATVERSSLRERMQIVTKCGIKLVSKNRPENSIKHYDTSRAHILRSVENSLKMLRTDRVDLLLIHRPDPLMDADEVAGAFTGLKQSGKVLYFGVSNFMPWQFELLASRLDFPLVTNQVELSIMNMGVLHDGTIDMCQRHRISPMAWSPFGGGRLFQSDSERAARVREALAAVGERLGGASIDQVALAWILTHPAGILPVLGTGKLDRIESASASEALKLSREQWFTLWSASTGHEVP